MFQSMSLPICRSVVESCGGWDGIRTAVRSLGIDGIEAIWGGAWDEMTPPPADIPCGYHLTFWPDWLDFYRDDVTALTRKFGSAEAAYAFYGGRGGEHLIRDYKADLKRSVAIGAKYVVFHVSDVSLEEGYTYRWEHTHEEVIDAAIECINAILKDVEPTFDFLVENQWWPGFTFTDPAQTARLLEGIDYPRKGILLDTGHLMNCNTAITSEADGLAYIHSMLDLHGTLSREIKGMHLHQSVSGAYVRAQGGRLPVWESDDYNARFGQSYGHILQIDRHQPWTDAGVAALIARIDPLYLTHELSAPDAASKIAAIQTQRDTMRRGGMR
ncbi:MAG: TIM barrel protein [Butyricicoccus sp.]|nr:TIM barrel protein [Butyricicoccus sp.]